MRKFLLELNKLIKDVIKGKRKAQMELYRLCFNTLMSVCSRYKKNKEDAAFLANDAFLKILTNLTKYDKKALIQASMSSRSIMAAIE